jgi:hypothetical protein
MAPRCCESVVNRRDLRHDRADSLRVFARPATLFVADVAGYAPEMRWISWCRPLIVLALLGALLGACGDDDDARPSVGDQPAPDVTTFQPGAFDDLPMISGSRPLGPRREQGAISVRTFAVTNLEPVSIINFYDSHLVGWTRIDRDALGTGVRARYGNGDRALEVTAIPAPTAETATNSSKPVGGYQYTLLYGPLEEVLAATGSLSASTTSVVRGVEGSTTAG